MSGEEFIPYVSLNIFGRKDDVFGWYVTGAHDRTVSWYCLARRNSGGGYSVWEELRDDSGKILETVDLSEHVKIRNDDEAGSFAYQRVKGSLCDKIGNLLRDKNKSGK